MSTGLSGSTPPPWEPRPMPDARQCEPAWETDGGLD
jgi:hypothetical protein